MVLLRFAPHRNNCFARACAGRSKWEPKSFPHSTTAGKDTDLTVFLPDLDPTTHTDPLLADTDLDGILDGTEDLNRNGRVDSGEAHPQWWDTDRDGLPDGWVNFGTACTAPCVGVPLGGSWGEDKDLDGIRDQNTDGDWTETDFLAADSDVDGINDGWEQWGRWCYKTETGAQCDALTNRSVRQLWVASPEKNGALIADFDEDGLRDGQEIAGWTVGIWRERTMEKVRDYVVASSPLLVDGESDTLTDFSEFMNGSDPGVLDTDGDGITDPQEIARKSNITGIEGTPPQISNVKLQVGIDWDWWGLLYLPYKSHVQVSFDVSDNVGLDVVTVRFIRYSGTETREFHFSNAPGSSTVSTHLDLRFDFSIFEALAAGADVNITAYDVNGNGAWGDFHIKSVLEAIADAIAAFLSAIVKIIVEAASAALSWIISMLQAVVKVLVDPIIQFMQSWAKGIASALTRILAGSKGGPSRTCPCDYPPSMYVKDLWGDYAVLQGLMIIVGILIVLDVFLFIATASPTPWALLIAVLALVLVPAIILGYFFSQAGFTDAAPGGTHVRDEDLVLHVTETVLGIITTVLGRKLLGEGAKGLADADPDTSGLSYIFLSIVLWILDDAIYFGTFVVTGGEPSGGASDLVHKILLGGMIIFAIAGFVKTTRQNYGDLAAQNPAAPPPMKINSFWQELFAGLEATLAIWGLIRAGMGMENL